MHVCIFGVLHRVHLKTEFSLTFIRTHNLLLLPLLLNFSLLFSHPSSPFCNTTRTCQDIILMSCFYSGMKNKYLKYRTTRTCAIPKPLNNRYCFGYGKVCCLIIYWSFQFNIKTIIERLYFWD